MMYVGLFCLWGLGVWLGWMVHSWVDEARRAHEWWTEHKAWMHDHEAKS